ncbi:hypothetical protein Q8A67_018250 [Cirrhinus molitorella]|uniref:Uncharacterized protein n=1 Tax=Cirrhinus molitorella TaxID=172907 RepID=A0AA88P8S1_9TELE|nr:hypothetical protein Q8A67_018250 [Cirrhinus molitorella]
MGRLLRWAGTCRLLSIVCVSKPELAGDFILRHSFFIRMALRPAQRGFRMRTNLWKGKLCVDCAQPLSPGRRVRADAGHLSGGVADMVRQGMGRCAKTVPASTSDLLALDQHACAIQPANTPLYAAGPNSKPCPAPLLLIELIDQRAVLLSHTSIRVLLPSLPPHTKPLPAVPTSITASLRYTSIVAPRSLLGSQQVLCHLTCRYSGGMTCQAGKGPSINTHWRLPSTPQGPCVPGPPVTAG